MSRINPLEKHQADDVTAATLTDVQSQLGMLPNLFTTLAHAPAALNGYLGLNDTLGQGQLSLKQREMVALAVAQFNQCGYCLSAHSLIAKNAGLSDAAITAARNAVADNELDGAVISFAREVTKTRGVVPDAVFESHVGQGLTPALMVEIVANVAVNLLTNYVNNLAETDIDFPNVEVTLPAAA